MIVEILDLGIEIAFLLVKEGLAVCDQVLKITDLRLVDRGEINFVENSMRERKPYPACGIVSRPNPLFCAARPARDQSRTTEGFNTHYTIFLTTRERLQTDPKEKS